jgi:hypothetical protein
MRKKITSALIVSLLLLSSVFAQEWPTFKSTEENFTISLPGEPKQERTAALRAHAERSDSEAVFEPIDVFVFR